jgi:hypothetical protein
VRRTTCLMFALSVLIAGCSDKPEATVHVDGKIEVIIKEEKKEPIKIKKDPGGTIMGNGKKFDTKDF